MGVSTAISAVLRNADRMGRAEAFCIAAWMGLILALAG